jgi:hypothetical protein
LSHGLYIFVPHILQICSAFSFDLSLHDSLVLFAVIFCSIVLYFLFPIFYRFVPCILQFCSMIRFDLFLRDRLVHFVVIFCSMVHIFLFPYSTVVPLILQFCSVIRFDLFLRDSLVLFCGHILFLSPYIFVAIFYKFVPFILQICLCPNWSIILVHVV